MNRNTPMPAAQWTRSLVIKDAARMLLVALLWAGCVAWARSACPYTIADLLGKQSGWAEAKSGTSAGSVIVYQKSNEYSYQPCDGCKIAGRVEWTKQYVGFRCGRPTDFNVTTGAVTEYDKFECDSITLSRTVRCNNATTTKAVEDFIAREGTLLRFVHTTEDLLDIPARLSGERSMSDGFRFFGPSATVEWTNATWWRAVRASFPRCATISVAVLCSATLFTGYPRSLRASLRLRRNLCPRCAYPANPGLCPECGLSGAFPAGVKSETGQQAPREPTR